MSNQRLINDARRRARTLSRANGSSYQACLDDVARSTGADDWDAFVADPRPLPTSRPDLADPVVENDADGRVSASEDLIPVGRNRYKSVWNDPVDWRKVSRMVRQESHRQAIATFLLFAAFLLLMRSPVAHLLLEMPVAVSLGLLVVTMMIGFLLLLHYVIFAISAGTVVSLVAHQKRPRLGLRYWLRIWGDVGLRLVLATTLFFGFAKGFPDFAFGASQIDAASIAEDAGISRRVSFADATTKPIVLGPVKVRGDRSIVELVVADQRSTPRAFRSRRVLRDMGGAALNRASIDHPVIRMRGTVDCGRGTFRSTAITTADSVGGPARYALPRKGRKDVRMAASSLPLLCPQAGTGDASHA